MTLLLDPRPDGFTGRNLFWMLLRRGCAGLGVLGVLMAVPTAARPMSPMPLCTSEMPKGRIDSKPLPDRPTSVGEFVSDANKRYPAVIRLHRAPDGRAMIEAYVLNAEGKCQWVTRFEPDRDKSS